MRGSTAVQAVEEEPSEASAAMVGGAGASEANPDQWRTNKSKI